MYIAVNDLFTKKKNVLQKVPYEKLGALKW